MPRPRGSGDLLPFEKGEIFALSEYAGFTQEQIHNTLQIQTSTVKKYLQRVRRNNNNPMFNNRIHHRQIATTQAQIEAICNQSMNDRFRSANDIKRNLNLKVSARTVSRRLNQFGLKARSPSNKIKINDVNAKRRLQWANDHKWNVLQWKRVTFSDECCVTVGRGHRKYVRRFVGERDTQHCVEKQCNISAGSVSIWGAFSWYGFSPLARLRGRQNSETYINVLLNNFINVNQLQPPNGIGLLMQDNSPIHKSRLTMQFIRQHRIQLLDWPAYSADCNPIENVWGLLKTRIRKLNPQPLNPDVLFDALQIEWKAIMNNCDLRRSYVSSMPRRIRQVISADGYYSKY